MPHEGIGSVGCGKRDALSDYISPQTGRRRFSLGRDVHGRKHPREPHFLRHPLVLRRYGPERYAANEKTASCLEVPVIIQYDFVWFSLPQLADYRSLVQPAV